MLGELLERAEADREGAAHRDGGGARIVGQQPGAEHEHESRHEPQRPHRHDLSPIEGERAPGGGREITHHAPGTAEPPR